MSTTDQFCLNHLASFLLAYGVYGDQLPRSGPSESMNRNAGRGSGSAE
jgi:hypothetical protein